MTDSSNAVKKINKAIALLEQAIAELTSDTKAAVKPTPAVAPGLASSEISPDILGEIKALSRDEAIARLDKFSHKALGEIFVLCGGGKADKKRAKDWLKGRILFYLFDFRSGHNIVRGNSETTAE